MVKTLSSSADGVGSTLGWGAKLPYASWPEKKSKLTKMEMIL